MSVLLTIVVPTYNSAKTLSACFESIVEQTFINFEVCVVDGISNDETLSIIKSFSDKDSRFRWVSEPDKGIYDAMNKGIRLAQGEWIYFMGGDDSFYDRNTLANIFQHDLSNYEVVYGDVMRKRLGRYEGEFDPGKIINKNICHQAIFFRKSLFQKVGDFNIKYKSNADYAHNLKWFFNKEIRKKYLNVIVANYAEEGFSSTYYDAAFRSSKNRMIIKYGWRTMDSIVLAKVFGREAKSLREEGKVFQFLLFKMVNLVLKASFKISSGKI